MSKEYIKDLMNDVESLVLSYESTLKEKGIKCTISKKYFETKADLITYHSTNIFRIIENRILEKREDKYFKNQHNRHHCVVLCFSPIDKKKSKDCVEYSFIIDEIKRMKKGLAPKHKNISKDKFLNKIEKTIKKILRETENKSPEKVCNDNFLDGLRYIFNIEYRYKKSVFGKDITSIEFIIDICSFVIIIIFAVLFYVLLK